MATILPGKFPGEHNSLNKLMGCRSDGKNKEKRLAFKITF